MMNDMWAAAIPVVFILWAFWATVQHRNPPTLSAKTQQRIADKRAWEERYRADKRAFEARLRSEQNDR